MKLVEFAEAVADDASVDPKVALRVIRSVYNNLTEQLERDGVAQMPVFGKITSREVDGGRLHYTLHRRKVPA